MASPWFVIKHIGPKLVPFFKSVAVFFVLYPNKSEPNLICLLTKCLPIVMLGLFVLMHGISFRFEYSYSRRIFTGLLFSMIGDACLVYKEKLFIYGVLAFAVSHIIFFSAFGIKPFNFRLAFALIAFAVPICAVYMPFLSNYILKVIIPLYIILLMSMLWRALSRLEIFNKNVQWTWPKLCCSLGALCFVISDSVLSFDLFIYELPYSHPIVMITYYAAQLGIALSVVDSYESHEVNKRVIQHQDLIKAVQLVYSLIKSQLLYSFTSSVSSKSHEKSRKEVNNNECDLHTHKQHLSIIKSQ